MKNDAELLHIATEALNFYVVYMHLKDNKDANSEDIAHALAIYENKYDKLINAFKSNEI